MSDYTKCPKCGSPESWPEINGHHSYECHSFMTKEGGFGQDDYCRRLAEVTAPLRAKLDEISKEFFCYKIASKAYTEDVTALRAQLGQVTKERDEVIKKRDQLNEFIGSQSWHPDDLRLEINITQKQRDTARAQRDRAMEAARNLLKSWECWQDKQRDESKRDSILSLSELEREIAKEKEGGA